MTRITAAFPDTHTATAAVHSLRDTGTPQSAITLIATGDISSRREARFMGRIVIVVAFWSVLGGAIGAALGALIAAVIGPSGTEVFVIQTISWMIFGHLIAGMWAGYLLLADRTAADLPAVRAKSTVLLSVDCANIDETATLANRLRDLGATNAEITED